MLANYRMMLKAGDSPGSAEATLERLFLQHYATVLAYARRRAPEAMIDDVVAETFLVAWRRIDDVPANALPWLLSVARRTLSTQLRSARRRSTLIEKLELLRSDAASTSATDPIDASVIAAFGRLAEKDQEALTLVAWEGLKPREAAVVMGEAAGRFRVRLHRARRRLQRELDAHRTNPTNRSTPMPVTREGTAK